MQCRNGSESRHLINMPFIWPLHTSLKQEPLLQQREPGRSRRAAACCPSCASWRLGHKVQPAKIMRLVCHCLDCHSNSPQLWSALPASPGHSFILLFSFICMSFASPSLAPWVFSGHCAPARSRLPGRQLLMTVVCTINMHCASRVTLRKPLYILPTFLYPNLMWSRWVQKDITYT